MMDGNYQIGIDIGGTFTDIVVFDEASGTWYSQSSPIGSSGNHPNRSSSTQWRSRWPTEGSWAIHDI